MFESISPKKENAFRQNEAERTEEGLDRRKFVLMSILASAGIILSKNKIYSILKGFIENGGDAETQPDVSENKTTRNEETDQKKEYVESEEDREKTEAQDKDAIGETFKEQLRRHPRAIILDQPTRNAISDYWEKAYGKNTANYRDGIVGGLERMQPWAEGIKDIFRAYRVPEKFIYLSIAESNFKIRAVSGAGAAGPFQGTAGTSENFGLKIGKKYDERLDPLKSANLCAAHLRESFERFGGEKTKDPQKIEEIWTLSVLAYNGSYVNDFAKSLNNGEIRSRGTHIIEEGENPSIIANRFHTSLPLLYRANADTKKTSFKEWVAESKKLQPGTRINIPQEYDLSLEKFYAYLGNRISIDIIEELSNDFYTIKRGDTFKKIAEKFGLSQEYLKKENPSLNYSFLKIGQKLNVPRKYKSNTNYLLEILANFKENINYPEKFEEIYKIIEENDLDGKILGESKELSFKTMRLKKAGSLYDIAVKEKIDLEKLVRLNPAVKKLHYKLEAGTHIRVPLENGSRLKG